MSSKLGVELAGLRQLIFQSHKEGKEQWLGWIWVAAALIPCLYASNMLQLVLREIPAKAFSQQQVWASSALVGIVTMLLTAGSGRWKLSLPVWIVAPAVSVILCWLSFTFVVSGTFELRPSMISILTVFAGLAGGCAWLAGLGLRTLQVKLDPKVLKEKKGLSGRTDTYNLD